MNATGLRYTEIILVDRGRIELPPKPCKGPVLPLSLTAHYRFLRVPTIFLKDSLGLSRMEEFNNLVLLLACQSQEQGPSAQGTQFLRLSQKLVPHDRIELPSSDYKTDVLPFN